jgi:hypothetical protein
MFGGDFLFSHFSVNDSCYVSEGRAKKACVNKTILREYKMPKCGTSVVLEFTPGAKIYTLVKVCLVNSAKYEVSN